MHRRPAIQNLLEQKLYAPGTIKICLAAVRRVACEAADSGLLSPELAAGIRPVKGVRRIGVRVGNWLTAVQGKRLLFSADRDSLRGKRNYAILAMLIGCGLGRGELLGLHAESMQLREEHWVIANLLGKAGHIRTVPIPPVGEGDRHLEAGQWYHGGRALSIDQQSCLASENIHKFQKIN
jgi:integrase